MNFALKGLLALFWLMIVPASAGALFFRKEDRPGLTDRFFAGYLFLFSSAELLTLTMMVLRLPLHVLVACYGVLTALSAAAGAFRMRRTRRPGPDQCGTAADAGRRFARTERPGRIGAALRGTSVFFWAALAVIALQLAVVVLFAHFDADDALYVATASTAVETDSIFRVNAYTGALYTRLPRRYILSPFPIFLAVISQLCAGLHPAIMAHTVFPAVFLVCSYLVVYRLGRLWFPDDRNAQGIFLFLAAMLCWFSAYSMYNAGNFQMVRLWQGKALLAAFLLPLVFFLSTATILERTPRYPWHLLLMANLSCCLLSSMGIILAPLMMGIFAVLGLLRFRSLKRALIGLVCCLPSIVLGIVYILL